MKKLLFSFLPVLLVVLSGLRSYAADYSVTVLWDTPGTIEVIKGSNPSLASSVKLDLAADQTSLTITQDDRTTTPENYYWFIPAEDYTLTGVSEKVGSIATIVDIDGVSNFKLQLQYESNQTSLNGKTFKLDVAETVYSGEFNVNVDNGAERLKLNLLDADGNRRAVKNITDGINTVKLQEGDVNLEIRTSDNQALYEVKSGEDTYEFKLFKYLVPVSAGSEVYIAATDPALASIKHTVSFTFTNDNPQSVTVFDWTSRKMVENFADGIEVVTGTQLKVNAAYESDYTYNSLFVNGTDGTFGTLYTISEDTEFTIDATTITYTPLEATLYANDIDALTFSNSSYALNAGEITITNKGDRAAGSVSLAGYTIPVATTEYTLGNISGKTKNVFFDIKSGYWVKNMVCGNPEEPGEIYISGTSAFNQKVAPVFIETGKIEYDTPVMVYYDGPVSTTILRAKYRTASGSEETVPYQNAGNGEYLVPGWNKIMIDPDYNNTFEISMNTTDGNKTYTKLAVLDGTTLKANDDNSDKPGVYQNVVLAANSILQVFFTQQAPAQYTLDFITAGDVNASLTCGAFAITDFSKPISLYAPAEYTVEATDGTKAFIGGKAVTSFTPEAGKVTGIQLVKEGFGTLECTSTPATGATVKTLSSVELLFPFNFDVDASFYMCENPASWISVSDGTKTYAAASVEPGEPSEAGMPFAITLASPITEAGKYTVSVPAGVIFETFPDTDYNYVRTAASRVNPELAIEVTVDPSYTYKWTFDPADASENDLPEDNLWITLSLPEAKALDTEAFSEGCGPWLTYNDQPITKSDDLEETPGWTFTQSMATWGKPAFIIEISKEIFSVAGELKITADEGAFTVNGTEASPAISYTAKFGTVKEYEYEFTPTVGSEISEWKEFTLTFPEAKTIAIDESNADFLLQQGFSWGIQIPTSDVTVSGNTATFKVQSEGSPKDGTLTLRIVEGSFIIDGTTPSPDIAGSWTYKRASGVDFSWKASPEGKIVNMGYGLSFAIVFADDETVSSGDAYKDIVVKFNDEELPAYNYNDDSVMGYQKQTEYGNPALMFMVSGGNIYDKTTTGTVSVSIPAGAVKVSGQPNPEAIEYTWQVIEEKEYTYVVTPTDGQTVKSLSEITIEFPEAETAKLGEYFQNGWVSVKQGYSVIAKAETVEAVEDAEHPTFKIALSQTIDTSGEYTVEIWDGAFYLDGAQGSPTIKLSYTVDPDYSGISGIVADPESMTVVNLQGIIVLRDADAEAVKSLPAGIYIVNGKKISVK